MEETEYGELFDVTYDATVGQDVIFIDSSGQVYLTKSDLIRMMVILDED